jgi:hypothetical protein
MELKDWLNSINSTKQNLIDEDPNHKKQYVPYVINKCFAGHLDAIMFANEMNLNHHLDKKMQYDFLLNTLRKKKRFSPWLKKEDIENFECVKSYYGFSTEKAKQALSLLDQSQINYIKTKLDTGGIK